MAKSKNSAVNMFEQMQAVKKPINKVSEVVVQKEEENLHKSDSDIQTNVQTTEFVKPEVSKLQHPLSEQVIKETPHFEEIKVNSNIYKSDKRKVGRPATRVGKQIRFAFDVPEETAKKIEMAKRIYDNNLTLYMQTLIEKDMKENYNMYEKLASLSPEDTYKLLLQQQD